MKTTVFCSCSTFFNLSKINQSSATLLPKKSDTLWIELDTVESTNNYAMALVHEGVAQQGMVVYAHYQSRGKGQRAKIWETIPGANLSFSIIIQPENLLPKQAFQLLAVTAIAIHRQLKNQIGEELKIKWPNDLYWRDRKTGGILIENVIRGSQWQWAVIGIGININQTSFSNLQNPVSLKQITGKDFNIPQLAKEIYKEVMNMVGLLAKTGFTDFFTLYNQQLYKLNETVRFKKGSRNFETTIKAVNEQGQLVTGVDIEECFNFGEIEWIIT